MFRRLSIIIHLRRQSGDDYHHGEQAPISQREIGDMKMSCERRKKEKRRKMRRTQLVGSGVRSRKEESVCLLPALAGCLVAPPDGGGYDNRQR
jgi:hypothetical protein